MSSPLGSCQSNNTTAEAWRTVRPDTTVLLGPLFDGPELDPAPTSPGYAYVGRHIENRDRCGKLWIVWTCGTCEREYRAPYRCDERICLTCAKRRRAKLIAKHRAAIAGMRWPAFITLTRKNVTGPELRATLRDLVQRFHAMRRLAGWRGKVNAWGLWTMEVTFNEKDGTFHPHLHAIIETAWMPAGLLAKMWEIGFTNIRRVRDARLASLELLKYVTKAPQGTPDAALEVIGAAFARIRGVQPFGKARKRSDSQLDKNGFTGHNNCPCCGGKMKPGRTAWPLEAVEHSPELQWDTGPPNFAKVPPEK